jgi:membrane protein HdeD
MASTESAPPPASRPGTTAEAAADSAPAATAPPGPVSHGPSVRHEPGPVPRSRLAWDIAIGLILVVTGALVLGDVVVASLVSVLFLGWTLLIGGAVGIAMSLWRVRRGGFWIAMLGSALALVAGLVFVRNPGGALLALSLAIGAVMLVNGITRLVAAVQHPEARWVLVASGTLSLILGLLILNRWPASALWLIGTLLGIQLIVDGITLVLGGRPRPVGI